MVERNAILDIRDLHVWFRVYEGLSKVLDGVSLHVQEGERVGLVGETGCGKSITAFSIFKLRGTSAPKSAHQGKVNRYVQTEPCFLTFFNVEWWYK